MKLSKIVIQLTVLMTFLMSATAFAGPGDGTLPLIKSIDVSFIDGNIPMLPETQTISVNIALSKGQEVVRQIDVNQLRLCQKITLSNVDGELDVKVKSSHSVSLSPITSSLKSIGRATMLNDVFFPSSDTLTQSIVVNY